MKRRRGNIETPSLQENRLKYFLASRRRNRHRFKQQQIIFTQCKIHTEYAVCILDKISNDKELQTLILFLNSLNISFKDA